MKERIAEFAAGAANPTNAFPLEASALPAVSNDASITLYNSMRTKDRYSTIGATV